MTCFYRDSFFFFFNDTATTEIYTLSLHDALPISQGFLTIAADPFGEVYIDGVDAGQTPLVEYAVKDRKSTRLNSSHGYISYAVFCLKKKTKFSFSQFPLTCVQLTQPVVPALYHFS